MECSTDFISFLYNFQIICDPVSLLRTLTINKKTFDPIWMLAESFIHSISFSSFRLFFLLLVVFPFFQFLLLTEACPINASAPR